MTVGEIMTRDPVRIDPEESAAVAARELEHYNIGALPVCSPDGQLRGMITDRDLVTRCMAAGRNAAATRVRDIMTSRIVTVTVQTEVSGAAELMGREQIRRLPVLENGRLCGMVSLCDIAAGTEKGPEAGTALAEIGKYLSHRDACPLYKVNKKD